MSQNRHWWERREFAALLVLAMFIPLVWPPFPPLTDLPGHMGRYAVQLDGGRTPALAGFYRFDWALIGNLGVDLLIIPLAPLLGIELATKLIIMTIPAMTVAGLLWICREVNREVQPTALFALPLAFGHPFAFGFVNFALAMALALLAFALWLRLARFGRLRLRAALFVVIGPLLWITHTFGWGMLGVLAFSAELIRQHDKGQGWLRSAWWSGVHSLALAPPIALMLFWRGANHVQGQTVGWFNWQAKWVWVQMTLRGGDRVWDQFSLALIAALPVLALFHRRFELSRNLVASALFLTLVFALLPRMVFGSAYADMRLTPYVFAIAVIAIRHRPTASVRLLSAIAVAGLVFYVARLTTTTIDYARASALQQRALPALDHVPRGARLVSFVGHSCLGGWRLNPNWHLPAMAIVRRGAYSNDQWELPGAQLLRATKYDAGSFRSDPSQVTIATGPCRNKWRSIDWSLANFPRAAFDYVWLIDPPRFDPRGLRGLTPVWSNGRDALFRVDRR